MDELKLPEDVMRLLHRVWSITLIKEDPNDDPYDTLDKIRKMTFEILVKHDDELRRLHEANVREREAARQADKAMRD